MVSALDQLVLPPPPPGTTPVVAFLGDGTETASLTRPSQVTTIALARAGHMAKPATSGRGGTVEEESPLGHTWKEGKQGR